MPALHGITVVALEQAVAAPFATRQLADLGARVIKIERPGVGDFARDYDTFVAGQSSYFVWLNRGKQSVALDLKDPQDLEVVTTLLDRADVFVQNLAPGAADRLGLDPKSLCARNSRLICCSISGYGTTGPYASKKAYDLLIQCETGLVSITGSSEEPAKVGISIADIAAGMYAFSGVLQALYARERTGKGSVVEVAMIDALGEWMSQPLYATLENHDPTRTGARHASIAPYGPYRVAGGEQVFIGIQNEREWAIFCAEVLRRPELTTSADLATNSLRVAHDDELTALIESALATLSAEETVDLLDRLGIANARLRTPAQFALHPQLTARDRWSEIAVPGGHVRALRPPIDIAGSVAEMGAVPRLGEHTRAIRAELGLDDPVDHPQSSA
jgi:crotonobetainyl-CoA:carnitine CoA-transferase CaiB-like acyl-CoA transferase